MISLQQENKRYFKIDQHLARHFDVYYVDSLSSPHPFLFTCSQITPFLYLKMSTNQEKRLEF